MSEHYYSKTPKTESKPKQWSFNLLNHNFHFVTDAGVFSKNEVDFGSRVLIETFKIPFIDGDIVDVGCGYGPIGLAIAKTNPDRTVYMVDVNERAISLAKKNAQINGIQNVKVIESDCLSAIDNGLEIAAVITNPPIRAGKKVIFKIYDEAYEKLQKDGELWIVIQKKQGAPSTISYLEEKYESVEVVEKKKGYWIIKAKK